MLGFLKRLFMQQNEAAPSSRIEPSVLIEESAIDVRRESASDAYYETMGLFTNAISGRDYEHAAGLVNQNLNYIPGWVQEICNEFGAFDIGSIPALEQGGTILALVGDEAGMSRMRDLVSSLPPLEPWTPTVGKHEEDAILFNSILEAVESHPNCLQTEVKGFVGVSDGRRVANLLSYLEKAGKVVRKREGRTYRITPGSSPSNDTAPVVRVVKSHRDEPELPQIQEIDISSLEYVPLPRAPLRWEEALAGRERAQASAESDHFEIRDAEWQLATMKTIPYKERPDPAFRKFYSNNSGIVMIDDLGKAEGFEGHRAAALRYDRRGKEAYKEALAHDLYRIGVHPMGRDIIAMSRECVVHCYDEQLKLTLETDLSESPEIRALRRRFEIPPDGLKYFIRCVGLSKSADRYLITAVDEAWCVDVQGRGIWGARLPLQEGWTRLTTPGESIVGTSEDVRNALNVVGLSMPFEPSDLTRRYRELAKQYHPDLNHDDPLSEEKMRALNQAVQVLTGVGASRLPAHTESSFVKEMSRSEFEVSGFKFEISASIGGDEATAADWIYATSFASKSDSVYLAGYSGRVILVDQAGRGVRAYDIGTVPRQIADVGDYLYILTDTRLYVLRDKSLHALVDTFDGGDLIVAQTGFGLIENKRLRWFAEDGSYLGSILSKAPIRRVYCDGENTVVETRQRRAIITGAPTW